MGTDDLHNKKRERGTESLKRRKPVRAAYDVVLIVCEGTKTEPNYFCDIRDDYRLNSANIKVDSGTGSDPLSVANTAIKLFQETNDYDNIYCVIDKDSHPNYQEALTKIESTVLRKREGKKFIGRAEFKAIVSVPCFEYWFLLHFRMTDSPYSPAGSRSICEQVIRELNKYIPNYSKGDAAIYARTKDRLSAAILHAKQGIQSHIATGTDNPSTTIYELVEKLQDLKK